ncbi:MAG: hypothetical protein WCN21_11280, partial [Comamonadaceae bacterium]
MTATISNLRAFESTETRQKVHAACCNHDCSQGRDCPCRPGSPKFPERRLGGGLLLLVLACAVW